MRLRMAHAKRHIFVVSCFPAPGRAAVAAVLAFLLVVSAAHGAPPLVGVLPLGSPTDAYDVSLVEAFREGLRDGGLAEGRDLLLEIVWTRDSDELGQPVLKLNQRGARVLVPVGTDNSMAVKRRAPT